MNQYEIAILFDPGLEVDLEQATKKVRKIESVLNITDEVIRFLIVRPDLKKLAKAEAEKARKAEQAAKRGESDDKEEEEEE